jgi:hypothetical protein
MLTNLAQVIIISDHNQDFVPAEKCTAFPRASEKGKAMSHSRTGALAFPEFPDSDCVRIGLVGEGVALGGSTSACSAVIIIA